MLHQAVRSNCILLFIVLCMQNMSLASIFAPAAGPKCLVYEEIIETTTAVVENVRQVVFDEDLAATTLAKYGEHIRLICDIDLPFKTWKARSKVMSEGLSEDQTEWDIKSLNLSLHGEYITCEAKLMRSSKRPKKIFGTSILISDLAPPLIRSPNPREPVVMEKAATTLECKIIEGVPAPTVSWQHMKTGDHKFRNLTESGEELKIENATLANAGQYRCFAVNARGQDNKTIDLTVQKLPVATIEEKLETTFPYGNTTEFTCKIQGYPLPKAVWSDNNGNILVSKDSNINWHEKISVLKLQNMKKSNNYTCTAENALGKSEAAVNVTVLSPFVVHEHPNVTTYLHYGTSRTLVCNITSSFPMKIKWFRPKTKNSMEFEEITNSNTYLLQSNNDLQIPFMDLNMVGNHTCEAFLFSDVNEKVAVTTDVQIDNLASPVLADATKIIAMEGNWITLFCEIFSGVPPPTLSWQAMKHGDSKYRELPETDEEMEIQNITISDAGRYRCTAKNAMGEISKDTEIQVRKAPVVAIEEGSAISVEYGSYHTFTCNVIAWPLPTIDWKSYGKPMLSQETTIHEHKKISKIADPKIIRDNAHTCHAKNILGHDEQTIYIKVLSPFIVHQIPAEITEVHYAASTKLVCNITSSFPMRIRWYHNSSEVHTSAEHRISTNQTVLEIISANLDLVGDYRCQASLIDDDLPKKDFTTTVHIDDLRVPVITYFGTPFITVKKFEELRLTCNADGNPKPLVTFTATLPGSYSPQFIENGESICSTNVGPGQAGTYICTASNVAGSDVRTIQVTVTS